MPDCGGLAESRFRLAKGLAHGMAVLTVCWTEPYPLAPSRQRVAEFHGDCVVTEPPPLRRTLHKRRSRSRFGATALILTSRTTGADIEAADGDFETGSAIFVVGEVSI